MKIEKHITIKNENEGHFKNEKDSLIFVKVKERKLKHYNKRTYIARLQVGNKQYKVNQNDCDYFNSCSPGYSERLGDQWYMTTSQIKSILSNNKVLIKHIDTFDGMIDGMSKVDDEFSEPSERFVNYILNQLNRRGLMRCHFDVVQEVFKLWSCVGDYEIKIEGVKFTN
jgi:hypothetical protein